MSGMWNERVSLYNRRLEAPEFASEPATGVPILFRLAQVVSPRPGIGRARARPRSRPRNLLEGHQARPDLSTGLRQLRHIYAQREQWDMLLQIAEMEEQLEMSVHERAGFLAELGDVWNGKLNDPTEALVEKLK